MKRIKFFSWKRSQFLITIWLLSVYMLCSCVSTPPQIYSDGKYKVINTNSKFKQTDFYLTDFFVKDIKNNYLIDFNEIIFDIIKQNATNSHPDIFVDTYNDEHPKPTYKEQIVICENEEVSASPETKWYIIWYEKCGEKSSTVYYYDLMIDAKNYGADFYDALDYLAKKEASISEITKQIEYYEWVLNNCVAPTIERSKTVAVPQEIQERVWNPGGVRLNTVDGSIGEPGHWEVRTKIVYVKEIQYYTEPNPNYNPQKVAEAKTKLPDLRENLEINQKIIDANSLLNFLPFNIFYRDDKNEKLIELL